MEKLILHNDEENSFLKIVASLIKNCDYNPMQAEQATVIAEVNGKVTIREGDVVDMILLEQEFLELNIKVTRETVIDY